MDILGINELNGFLNTWLEDHDSDYTPTLDTDFYCDYENETIGYALTESDDQIRCFTNYCQSLGMIAKLDYFTLAFLHELGHSETLDFIDDKTYQHDQKIKDKLNQLTTYTDKDKLTYYELTTESIATEWAINYINDNLQEVLKFNEKVMELIQNVYKLNGVE